MATATTSITPAFDALASLYAYPDDVLRATARLAADAVSAVCPGTADLLRPLADRLSEASLAECEERFVQTFELNPVCTLEVGWQLYGEQYARGSFLVRMRQLMREAGLPETTELPDHVTNVLRVIPRIADPSATKLAARFTLPAVDKMHGVLAKHADNPYGGLLAATVALLTAQFGTEVPSAE